jgi:site-specific DNA recombinase
MRTIVYSRVSTDAQEREGTSLDTQERACLDFAARHGWAVVEAIRDTASGATLDRPGIERARQMIRNGVADILLGYAADRLARDQIKFAVLYDEAQSAGVRLKFVSERFEDTAVGKFLLSARAFAAELEREKIAERTMRGKAERARSGRLPQGTGKGCYGYRYSPSTGTRSIDAVQGAVVRGAFEGYIATGSFSAVARELNASGLPSFTGGRWYPITIRSMLSNETYTGRTVYRRTRRIRAKSARTGRTAGRVVRQPHSEWIEIIGATPRIIDESTWQRVQSMIEDPERTKRRPEGRRYLLRGRLRCGKCGSAMVGQTLTVKGASYPYYRCRHAYTDVTGHRCKSRYVRQDELEAAVWREVRQVLADPAVVLAELTREREAPMVADAALVSELECEIQAAKDREKRLIRLFACDDIEESILRGEAAAIRSARTRAESRVAKLRAAVSPAPTRIDERTVRRVCAAIVDWLDGASDDDRALVLEALQVEVTATKDEATLQGVLPTEISQRFITIEQTSA